MKTDDFDLLTPFQKAVILLLEGIAKDIKSIADVGRE